jgi:hypothetical protein
MTAVKSSTRRRCLLVLEKGVLHGVSSYLGVSSSLPQLLDASDAEAVAAAARAETRFHAENDDPERAK